MELYSVHRRMIHCHEAHSESYTHCTRRYLTSKNVYTSYGRRTESAAMELYSPAQRVYKSSLGDRVLTAQ